MGFPRPNTGSSLNGLSCTGCRRALLFLKQLKSETGPHYRKLAAWIARADFQGPHPESTQRGVSS